MLQFGSKGAIIVSTAQDYEIWGNLVNFNGVEMRDLAPLPLV